MPVCYVQGCCGLLDLLRLGKVKKNSSQQVTQFKVSIMLIVVYVSGLLGAVPQKKKIGFENSSLFKWKTAVQMNGKEDRVFLTGRLKHTALMHKMIKSREMQHNACLHRKSIIKKKNNQSSETQKQIMCEPIIRGSSKPIKKPYQTAKA